MDLASALALICVALCSAMLAYLFIPRGDLEETGALAATDDSCVFLFDGPTLVSATDAAYRMMVQTPEGLSDWDRLALFLSSRFSQLHSSFEQLRTTGQALCPADRGGAQLAALQSGTRRRITLYQPAQTDHDLGAAEAAEMTLLRDISSHSPVPTWAIDENATVTWANRAYLDLVQETLGDTVGLVWPLPKLFPDVALAGTPVQVGAGHWYDCTVIRRDNRRIAFALPMDRAVQAETSLQNFAQTLTKTFAALPTGLAIFNKERQLVMFNPALLDLFRLDPIFLANRPRLTEFLDRLRELGMIPEPKNYSAWRHRLSTLAQQNEGPVFQEAWPLPTGQTFRITGQAHADGALALLAEDITSEIAMTRRFKAELDMGQAVIDAMDEAVAVFDTSGVLTLSNKAYATMWGSDPAHTLGEVGIHDATELWRTTCGPAPLWANLMEEVKGNAPRKDIRRTISRRDGGNLVCRTQSIAGGAVLVAFSHSPLPQPSATDRISSPVM